LLECLTLQLAEASCVSFLTLPLCSRCSTQHMQTSALQTSLEGRNSKLPGRCSSKSMRLCCDSWLVVNSGLMSAVGDCDCTTTSSVVAQPLDVVALSWVQASGEERNATSIERNAVSHQSLIGGSSAIVFTAGSVCHLLQLYTTDPACFVSR
jgi:hypothetical protein